jgi:hypothetical protein
MDHHRAGGLRLEQVPLPEKYGNSVASPFAGISGVQV